MQQTQEYDYIVVGAGSAGAIVASRLSEDRNCTVLLVEYGGSDRSVFIRMPSALGIPMNSKKYNWGFESAPEPHLNNRRMNCPRGKVLGGSSSINGMVYVRGHAGDYDEWEACGAVGWNYQNCLPYFKKLESHQCVASEYAGSDGPVAISGGNNMRNPLYRAFIDAGVEAGYAETEDYNGFRQEGFGQKFMTVDRGVRASTSHAYLNPAKSRRNLTLLKHAMVTRVVFDEKTATGIECDVRGKMQMFTARREVILCAGAIGSPHLLQVSGVGPEKVLQAAGIKAVHDLPGVGENLQDHLEFNFQYRCKQPISLNSELGLFKKALIGAQWLLFKTGLGRTNHFESCAFIRSRAGVKWADIQYHFLPAILLNHGRTTAFGYGYGVHVCCLYPKSRGEIKLRSNIPSDLASINPNYLEHPDDQKVMIDGVRRARTILAAPAFEKYQSWEIGPGPEAQTDEQILDFIRKKAETIYHPVGTCKMGDISDVTTVVDSELKVKGIEGLRVVDASVMPTLVGGNTNAPTIMIAERCADLIKQQYQ